MNRSGEIFPKVLGHYRVGLENLMVVVDQMDLPPGRLRLKPKGGDAGHNGLKSIQSHLATENYRRLYVGVGRPSSQDNVVAHVLGRPDPSESQTIHEAIERVSQFFADSFSRRFPVSPKSNPFDFWEHFQNGLNQSHFDRS